MKKRRRHFGDRKDGRRIRTLPPMSYVIPYIMRTRNDAQNFITDSIDITETDKYLREMRRKGMRNISVLHIFLAAYIRAIAMRPGINRFCSGQKIFHRNTIEFNMAVKKEMSLDAPDTMIKVRFEPTDTISVVYEKFNQVVENATKENSNTDFDKTAKALTRLPGLFFRWTVSLLNFMDYFGNLPAFLSYGQKYHKNVIGANGEIEKRTLIDFTAVVDERICDGFYYASAFKLIKKFVMSPALLETPPETVIEDID